VQAIKGGGMEVLGKLFLSNEEFRGRVRRTHIADEIEAVRVCTSTCHWTKHHQRSKKVTFEGSMAILRDMCIPLQTTSSVVPRNSQPN